MAENKRYYWLKLKEDFFEDDTITFLEEQENGLQYVVFYLKLCLKSLKNDGALIKYVGSMVIPYNVKGLAKLTNTSVDTVAIALKLFEEFGIIKRMDSGEIYLSQINEMIGSETRNAEIMRKKRARESIGLTSTNNVTKITNNVSDKSNIVKNCYCDVKKSYTEKEIEKDIDIEKEKEIEKDIDIEKEKEKVVVEQDSTMMDNYKSIIDYLNKKIGSKYKATTPKTQSLIKARFNEGFTVDDFKQVIDNKVLDWGNSEMEKYLRPITLFGTKFENYLNTKIVKRTQEGHIIDEDEQIPF